MEPTFPLESFFKRNCLFSPLESTFFLSEVGEMEFLISKNIICVFDVLV